MRLLLSAVFVGGLLVLAPARAREETPKVEVGKPAPATELEATSIDKVLPDKKEAKTLSLKDFQGKGDKGKNVVLFFFPKALTRGCTIESCGFRDKIEQFKS